MNRTGLVAVLAGKNDLSKTAANAERFGLTHRLRLIEGRAPEAPTALPEPGAVFVGGGFSAAVHAAPCPLLPPGARLVAHAVTLETEALLSALHARHGGRLLRIETAEAAPLGRLRGWEAGRPVVQWAVVA